MLKFFRKYTKHLLVAVTILILISWLLGSTLSALLRPKPGMQIIATAYGEEVKLNDLNQARFRADIMTRLGLLWQKPWIVSRQQLLGDAQPPLTPTEWMLLSAETRRGGTLITPAMLNEFKQYQQITPARLARIKEQAYLGGEQIDQILAEFLAVREYGEQNVGNPQCSTPEIQTLVRDLQEKVQGRALVFSSSALVDETSPADEAEIQAMFEQHKEQLPGQEGLGFGYKWPARVNVEYLSLSGEDCAPLVVVTEREALDHWTENKEQFRRPPPEETEGEEQPQARSPFYETFSEAKEAVVGRLRRDRARNEAERILRELTLDLTEGWDEMDEDGYALPPAGASAPDYYDQLLEIFSRNNPRFGKIIKIHRAELCTAEDLRALPGIGRAAFRLASGERHTFVELAMSTKGLAERPESGDSSIRLLYPAVYQTPDRVLRDADGGSYVFRVTKVVPPTVPASLEEVRDKVIADIRLKRAHEEAGRLAAELADRARQTSFDEAWETDTELAPRLEPPASIVDVRPTPRLYAPGFPAPFLGVQDEAFAEQVFALAQGAQPEGPHPIGVVEAPAHQRWVVFEARQLIPVTEDVYESLRDRARGMLLTQRKADARASWYSRKNIRQRAGFAPVRSEEADG